MSLAQTISGHCPFCNAAQELQVYSTVNVTVDPSLKEKVLQGTINDNTCTACRKTVSVVTALLYHDMGSKFIVSLNTADEEGMFATGDNPFAAMPGYIIREVTTYPALLEKIAIFDNKLNDIAVDRVADQYRESFRQALGHDLNVFFSKMEKGLFRTKIVYYCFRTPTRS